MNSVAAAVVILAGAVLGGAGAVAEAILAAANRPGQGAPVLSALAGGGVGLLGLVLLLTAPREPRRQQ
jgi:hypothetical protein